MNVRAKVRVESVEEFDTYYNDQPTKGAHVTMRAVVNDGGENKSWSAATPYGQFQMAITNPAAASFFKQGDELYVDFTSVSEAQ